MAAKINLKKRLKPKKHSLFYMRKISFFSLLMLFLWTIPAQAAQHKTSTTQVQNTENQPAENYTQATPIEPQQKQKAKKWAKKLRPQQAQDRMFPNSFAWTGVCLLIVGILMGLIFGGTLGTVASIIAAVGLIFIVVWIIQRLSYM